MASHNTGTPPDADQGPALPPAPLTVEELDALRRTCDLTSMPAARHVQLDRVFAQARGKAEAVRELACVVTHLRKAGITAPSVAARPWQGVVMLAHKARSLDEDLVATRSAGAEAEMAERLKRREAERRYRELADVCRDVNLVAPRLGHVIAVLSRHASEKEAPSGDAS